MKVWISTVLLSVAGIAGAAETETQATRADYLENCKFRSELAATIMKARQGGMPMMKLMESGKKSRYYQLLVELAYDAPLFHSDSGKEREITEFANTVYSTCMKQIPRDIPDE